MSTEHAEILRIPGSGVTIQVAGEMAIMEDVVAKGGFFLRGGHNYGSPRFRDSLIRKARAVLEEFDRKNSRPVDHIGSANCIRAIRFERQRVEGGTIMYCQMELREVSKHLNNMTKQAHILFNWNRGEGHEAGYTGESGIGVWFDHRGALEDYDGIFEMPEEGRILLERAGYDVDYLLD